MSGFSQASPVSAPPTHLTYRPDVDGLRAIAILAVLIFHAFPHWLPSGFIGVDIFFVISGFLITSIIQQDIQTASFRLSDFYSRRIRRIFPALILVMFCTLLAGWQSLLASEYKQLGKHVAFGAGFSANIVYWLESGYFDVSAQLKPLLHLWSLGVEEQFYVFWPLLLLGAAKLRMRPWIPVVLVLAISFFLNIYLVKSAATQTFFMLHTRAWQLAAGAIIAVLSANQGSRFSFAAISRLVSRTGMKPGNFCAFSGLALLVAGFVVIRNEQNFPGWYAILPTLGCALLIAGGAENMLAKYLLSNRLLVALGLISFPLYLWHWPLLSFAMILEAGKPSDNLKCLMLVLALVFAYFTYAGLEKPIRRSRHAQKIVVSLLVMLSALAYLGYNIYSREGLGFRAPDFQKISASQGEWEFPGELTRTEIAGVSIFAQATNNSQTTLFVGDSNLEQYYPRIAQLIRQDSQTNSVLFLSEG